MNVTLTATGAAPRPCGLLAMVACLLLLGTPPLRAADGPAFPVHDQFFPLVQVTVRVQDEHAAPVEGAEVVAYSDYWRLSLPAEPSFAIADARGEVGLVLPAGRWRFFAGSGRRYASQHPGHACFFSTDPIRIEENKDVLLRATRSSVVTLKGVGRKTFVANEVYAMAPECIPGVSMPFCGQSGREGGLTLHTTEDQACRLLVVSWPAAGKGYVLLSEPLPSWRRLVIQARPEELGRLRLEARDHQGNLGSGTIHLVLPTIDLQRYWQWPCFGFRQADIYVSPVFLAYFYRLDTGGCHYWFRYRSLQVEAGEEYRDGVGGPLTVGLKTSNDRQSQDATNIWFRAEDTYGNLLRFYNVNSQKSSALDIVFKQRDGQVVHREAWENSNDLCYRQPKTYPFGDQLDYAIEWDLGAYGLSRLQGKLLDAKTRFGWETIKSEHFNLSVALGSRQKGTQLIQRLEDTRAFMAAYTGSDPGRLNVHLPILPAAAGQAGGDTILVFMGGFLGWSPAEPVRGWERFLLHELGHHMIGRPHIGGWRNESLASLLAFEAIAESAGTPTGDLWKNTEAKPFLKQFAATVPSCSPQAPGAERFLMHIYLPRKCGQDIHKEFFQCWPSCREHLQDFSEAEAFAAVYSFLGGRNLAPLFHRPGEPVSTDRVAQALAVLREKTEAK